MIKLIAKPLETPEHYFTLEVVQTLIGPGIDPNKEELILTAEISLAELCKMSLDLNKAALEASKKVMELAAPSRDMMQDKQTWPAYVPEPEKGVSKSLLNGTKQTNIFTRLTTK